jgi:hypothetical protein
MTVQDDRRLTGHRTGGLALRIHPFGEDILGDTVAKFSRCGTELYVNTSCSQEDQLWAIGQALDHLRGLTALGAQSVWPLRWSRTAPYA